MSVSTAACCAALLQQQQQAIQHHEHCEQAASHDDKAVSNNAVNDTATIASVHSALKQCTIVERGRVVVKAMPSPDGTDGTHIKQQPE